VPTYPVFPTLSRLPALRTKTTTLDPTLRDPMENGMVTTRAKFTRRRRKWAVTIDFLTINDQNMLEEFVVNDAVYGANLFSFTDTRQPVAPELVYDSNGTAMAMATAQIDFLISRSLGITEYAVQWSDFFPVAPSGPNNPLPADAVIQGIYPVIIASGVFSAVTTLALVYGLGLSIITLGGTDFTSPSNPNNTSFSSTEFHGASIGTSIAALTGQAIQAMLSCSLDIPTPPNATPVMTDAIAVTGVGFAIYYTSATPTTDTTMPVPFTVPSGQGMAWALPFAVAQTGQSAGGGGIFSASTGQGTGTAVVGTRYTLIPAPQPLLVRFDPIPSYTDAGWMVGEFRQNASFGIEEA
jgi:hypothetical protein